MSTKTQGSQRWETCNSPQQHPSHPAAVSSLESFIVDADTGTTPVVLPNDTTGAPLEPSTEPLSRHQRETTPNVAINQRFQFPCAPGFAAASQPLPISSPWSAPARPESPGVAPNLLRRASRANITLAPSANPSSNTSHSRLAAELDSSTAVSPSFAALVYGHHAVAAPPNLPPAKILDCTAGHSLHADCPKNDATHTPGDGGAGAIPAASPNLRTAIAGGLQRRRSGSNSHRMKPARVRNNTKELIRLRRASLTDRPPTDVAALLSPTPFSPGSAEGHPTPDDSHSHTPQQGRASAPTALSALAPHRAPRIKPKPGAAAAAAPGAALSPLLPMHRSRSAAALPNRPDSPALEEDVARALEEGLVCMADVHVYGTRTHWQGFRHNDLHEPPVATNRRRTAAVAPTPDTPSTPALKLAPGVAAAAAAGAGGTGVPRVSSCPRLAALSAPALVKPEYSHRNHKQFLELYELGPVLGTGGYAVVRECTRKATGERFAAKMMTVSEHPESGGREVDRQALMNELDLMGRLQHPNVVRLLEYFLQDDSALPHCGACIIVMDLLEGSDLMDYLDEAGGSSRDDVILVMRCLLDAVSHMHGHGISHRDLKLENLVLARPRDLHSVTIVDFGLAKAARARERMEGVTGTLWYTAPEILLGEPYSPLVDLWSLGVVMYLLLTGDYPFDVPMEDVPQPPPDWAASSEDECDGYSSDGGSAATDADSAEARAEAAAAWRAEKREELLEDKICDEQPSWGHAAWAADPVAADLARGLLAKDPRARLAAAEALEHCWFTGHAAHDRVTLKHAHKRAAALAASSDQLPVRHFEAGEWIVEQNSRARYAAECFLILSGEASVLMHARASRRTDASGLLHLCTRRAGNFVGAVQLTADPADAASGGSGSSGSLRSSLGAAPHSFGGGCGGLAASFSSDSATLASLAWREDSWPACTGRSASQVSAANSGCSDGGVDAHTHEDAAPPRTAASLKLRTVFMVLRVAKRWIGHRRTVGVRADTAVSAVVLSHDDMRWAVAADYRMSAELSAALRARRLVVAKAIRAEKKACKEPAEAPGQSR